jgi:hypothetical protein
VGVDDGCPFYDGERAGGVLELDGACEGGEFWLAKYSSKLKLSGQEHTANVAKLAVFKDDELLAARNLVQASDGFVVEVGNNVCVGLEHADVIANVFGQSQQLVCGGDVGRNTQVGALEVDQTEEICC